MISSDSCKSYYLTVPNGDYTAGSILEHCIVEYGGGSNVTYNGAIRLENAHPFINYCTVQNNSASGICGWSLSSTLKIANTNVSINTSTGSGGAIYVDGYGTVNISNNTISNNTSNSSGGGIFVQNYAINIISNIIINNKAPNGGGIYTVAIGSNRETNILNNFILNNISSYTGGIYFSGSGGSKANISNNIIGNNTSDSVGGVSTYYNGYWGTGVIKVSYNNIIGNSAINVPSIYFYNYYNEEDIKYNTITNNKATDDNNSSVVIVGTPPTFNYNNIFSDNTIYELWYGNSKGSYGMLDAQYNWWGTSVEDEVTNKIHDFGDDSSYDIVNYTNYDTAIRTDAPISPPMGLTATPGNGQIALSWTANTESDTTGYKVYWNTDSGFPYTNSVDAGNQTNYAITGLAAGEYHVTVTAYDNQYKPENDDPNTIVNDNQTNGNESWFADEQTVTVNSTGSTPPKAVTKPATNITINSATLNGIVNAKGLSTQTWFEYGTTNGTYTEKIPAKILSSKKNRNVGKTIGNLSAGTTYYYRFGAENKDGKAYGKEMSFTTPADAKPIVTTGNTTSITTNSATLNGTINPNGLKTKAWFVYGTESGSLMNETAKTDVSGKINKKISASITGLSSGTPYYYKLVAENSEGTTSGDEKTFTTNEELKAKHVVIIDIDGLRPKLLSDCLKNGYAKNLEKLFGGNDLNLTSNAIWMKNCRTNFPSVTLSGQATIFTGCYINRHGIFGNEWFNRRLDDDGVRDYMSVWDLIFQSCSNKQNEDLQVKTIYEDAAMQGLKSLIMWNQFVGNNFDCANKYNNCLNQPFCYCQCTDNITWKLPNVFDDLPYYITDPYQYDQNMVTKAIEALNEIEEVPSIITLYFASVDHIAHCNTSGEQIIALNLIDKEIEIFLNVLKIKLGDPDLKEVLFTLVSDHGHTQVKTDEVYQVTKDKIKLALSDYYNIYAPAKRKETNKQKY